MNELWLLDDNLNRIHIIDDYTSLLWINRYNEQGDCEVKLPASIATLEKLRSGKYFAREDDDMVCRIEKIEIDTDEDSGDYIIVTGYDIKKILNQRIVWKQTNVNGFVEDYLRKLVTENLISPSINARKIANFTLGTKVGFTEKTKEQVTYAPVGDKISEVCKKYGWGYKVRVGDNKFIFDLFKGKDRSDYVMFSNQYENLSATTYQEDNSDIANVALTAGEGEGTDRVTNADGTASGLNRYELYVDARDLSKNIEYDELLENYPGGTERTSGDKVYYRVNGQDIALLTKSEADEVEKVELLDAPYKETLLNRGREDLATHVATKSFVGAVEPSMTFEYKKDYFLGDIVTVENDYGMSIEARIVEVMEVNDENGYSISPTFEYFEESADYEA